jgi:hypothetical protein
MSDLPLHEGVVGLLRHFGDPAFFDAGLYQLNLGHPNQLFHLVSFAVSFAVGTRWAVKLVIAATQIAILEFGARAADHLGRSRSGALLLAPLALGFTYYWGLVANLIGLALFFAALPLIDRVCVAPTARGLAKVGGVLLLLFFAHESALVMALCFVLLLVVAHPFSPRATALRASILAASGVLLAAYTAWNRSKFTGGQIVVPPSFPPFREKAWFLPAQLYGSHDAETRALLFALGMAGLLSLLVGRLRAREPLPDRTLLGPLAKVQALLLHYRWEAAGVGFLVAYFISPATADGATMVYERFIGPAWGLFALTVAPRGRATRLASFAPAGVPLGILVLSWPQFVDSDRTYKNLVALQAEIPQNSSVALASVDRAVYHTRIYSASTGPARTIADRGGRTNVALVMSPISPVQIRREWRWDELDRRVVFSGSRALTPGHDLKRFGWVIAQSRDPETRDVIIEAFKPDAELVDVKGEWLLLRSTHEQMPMRSRDVPPGRGESTILQRVKALTEARRQAAQERDGDER